MATLCTVPKRELSSQMERLLQASKQLQAGNWAPFTKYGYERDWQKFLGFCADFGLTPLPASDETLAAFATWCIDTKGYKVDSVARWLAAINYKHASNCLDRPLGKQTRAVMRGARRILKQRPQGRTPLSLDQLKAICTLLMGKGDRYSLRDRAILVLGFSAGFRESSIRNLQIEDIRLDPRGLIVTERFSKTDQEGIGRDIGIFPGACGATCPVRALQDWIAIRGNEPGPLFIAWPSANRIAAQAARNAVRPRTPGRNQSTRSLGRQYVRTVVKRAVQLIGLDPTTYGSHSLRAGCATTAAEYGASEYEIMRRTGHRDMEVVRKYIRPTEVFPKLDPFRGNL